MKIVIVGGGASGLLSALAIKEKHPRDEVTVVDKNNKLGKKLRATGNGKANILNLGDISTRYYHEQEAKMLITDQSRKSLLNFFHNHHIATINYGDYVYPYSESANAFTESLIKQGKALGVKYLSETKALDYDEHHLKTDKGVIAYDVLVVATGLGSSPQLGGDASFVVNLSKHGYDVKTPKAGLLPIKTKESTKEVNGLRRKVHVKLINNNKTYLDEDGELLFKKDGLSGIVIYHVASQIIRFNLAKPEVIVDFLPGESVHKVNLNDYFQSELATYLNKFKDPKRVVFHPIGFYDAKDSVASVGGVSLNNVTNNFQSKLEKNVYIIGEALDQDGLCGGYNLMWAFLSALKVSAII